MADLVKAHWLLVFLHGPNLGFHDLPVGVVVRA